MGAGRGRGGGLRTQRWKKTIFSRPGSGGIASPGWRLIYGFANRPSHSSQNPTHAEPQPAGNGRRRRGALRKVRPRVVDVNAPENGGDAHVRGRRRPEDRTNSCLGGPGPADGRRAAVGKQLPASDEGRLAFRTRIRRDAGNFAAFAKIPLVHAAPTYPLVVRG